jgi:hypothetical protein
MRVTVCDGVRSAPVRRFRDLEKRRNMELEGYTRDIQALQRKARLRSACRGCPTFTLFRAGARD